MTEVVERIAFWVIVTLSWVAVVVCPIVVAIANHRHRQYRKHGERTGEW